MAKQWDFRCARLGRMASVRGALLGWVALGFGVVACAGETRDFATRAEAMEALQAAIAADEPQPLLELLGGDAAELIDSGDPVDDKLWRGQLASGLLEKPVLPPGATQGALPNAGAAEDAAPLAIVKRDGRWTVALAGEREELLARRVHANEHAIIAALRKCAAAQREYFSVDRDGDGVAEFAAQLIGDADRRDGLYWKPGADQPPSPLDAWIAEGRAIGYFGEPVDERQGVAFRGYIIKPIAKQGPCAEGGAREYAVEGNLTRGFAYLAWPARHGNSGARTFMVDRGGTVLEQDFGKETGKIAPKIEAFDPCEGWRPVEEETETMSDPSQGHEVPKPSPQTDMGDKKPIDPLGPPDPSLLEKRPVPPAPGAAAPEPGPEKPAPPPAR